MTDHAQLALVIAALVGWCSAFAGSLLTKLHADQAVKAMVTYILATAAGIVPTVVWAPGTSWTQYALDVVTALALAVSAHYTGATNGIAGRTANVGLGGKQG